jgi:homogentisate 1,2-dioxygenase
MSGHGPDARTFDRATQADTTKPNKVADTMAFMFETRTLLRPTRYAMESPQRQADYDECWQGLSKHFNPEQQ